MLTVSVNMTRVHGLLTTFLKYNKLKLYKGNSPKDFLGKRHYATRRDCFDLDSLKICRLRSCELLTSLDE